MAKVSALLCCDAAVNSQGRWTLVGAFDELTVPELPADHAGFDIMIVLSDVVGRDETDIEVELVDFLRELDDAANAVVWYDAVAPLADARPRRIWLRFRTGPVRFVNAGIHEIRLLMGGEILETGAIRVRSTGA